MQVLHKAFRVSPGQRTVSLSFTVRISVSGVYLLRAGTRRSFSSPRMWNLWRSRAAATDSLSPRSAFPARSGSFLWPARQNLPVRPPNLSLPPAVTPTGAFRPMANTLCSYPGARGTWRCGFAIAMLRIPSS